MCKKSSSSMEGMSIKRVEDRSIVICMWRCSVALYPCRFPRTKLLVSASVPRIALGLRISTSICVIADKVRPQTDDSRTNRRLIAVD